MEKTNFLKNFIQKFDNKKSWMILSAILLGLFVGLSFFVFTPLGQLPLNVSLVEIGNRTWVAFNEPVYRGFIITDPECPACGSENLAMIIRETIAPTLAVEEIDYRSSQGENLIKKFGINYLPAIVFDKKIEKLTRFSQIQQALVSKDNHYYLKASLLGLTPGRFFTSPNMDTAYTIGDPKAPVTIVEWTSYQCPFSARFYQQTFNQIKEQYIDKGRVRYVFKDFPLSFQQNSQIAAEATRCAGEQKKFIEFRDLIFKNQQSWAQTVKPVNVFLEYGKQLCLDLIQFKKCLDDRRWQEAVLADLEEGQNFGINGTPGFLINNQPLSGAQPFSVFETLIEKASQEKTP